MGFVRGEYDRNKVERVRAPLRELWQRLRRSAVPDPGSGPHDLPPFDPFRLVLVGVVVALAALTISMIALPVAAVMARSVHGVNAKLGDTESPVTLPHIAQRSVVVARDGRLIAQLSGDQNRVIVSLSEIAPVAQQAVLAIEDARFYEHKAIDPAGLLRALFTNAGSGSIREGGSTITQQLVKNISTKGERTLDRKIKELRLAIAMERTIPKPRILELYLNEAYFGGGRYGIGTASEYYFGKRASDLTLPQAALLAGLISSPTRYDPLAHPEVARERRNVVLQRMADLSEITQDVAHRAAATPLGAGVHALAKPAEPYFLEFVKQQILNDPHFGSTREARIRALFEGGLRIETTLDLTLQEAAKKAVSGVLDRPNDPSAAMASIEPATGAIRAVIAGQDYDLSKFNLASARRQPGSTFKPFALVAALDMGVPPTLTLDTPSPIDVRFPDTGEVYKQVKNYDLKGEGYITLRRATELSVNSYYVQLSARIGRQRIVDEAKRMGITTELKPYPSIALGTEAVSPLEMSSAYATLANNGVHCKPIAITRVLDANGQTIIQNDPQCDRAIDSSVAALTSDILRGVIEHGTGTRANIGRPACGKTGTTDELGDAWFAGYTPQFATVVWTGYKDSHKPLRNLHGFDKVFGGTLPAEMWKRFMRAAHEGVPVIDFPKPPVIPRVLVPDVRGKSEADARKTLEAAGFTVKVEPVASSASEDSVVSQSPAGGAKVDPGVLVTLKVANGGSPPPSPSPSPSPTPEPSHSPSPSPSPTPSSTKKP